MFRGLLTAVLLAVSLAAAAQPGPVSGPMGLAPAGTGLAGYIGPGPAQSPGPSLDLSFVNGLPIDGRLTFSRASVGSYFDVTGALQTAAANAPRIDFDPVTHSPRGLLIEEARTNLLLNSATLATQNVTTTATVYTLSFYGTGSVALSGSFSGSLAGGGAFPTRSTLTFTPTAGSLTATVTGSVLDAQIEAGSVATSYIPTTTVAVTRAADLAAMPIGTWFNPAAGSLAVEVVTQTSVFSPFVVLNNGVNATNRVYLLGDNGLNSLRSLITAAGTGVYDSSTGGSVPLVNNAVAKFAISWGGAVTASYGNAGGGLGSLGMYAIGAVAVPTGLTAMLLGQDATGAVTGVRRIRRIRYWPRPLLAAELRSATA